VRRLSVTPVHKLREERRYWAGRELGRVRVPIPSFDEDDTLVDMEDVVPDADKKFLWILVATEACCLLSIIDDNRELMLNFSFNFFLRY